MMFTTKTFIARPILLSTLFAVLVLTSCEDDDRRYNAEITIPDFDFAKTVVFEQNLSAYNIFQGVPSDLSPADDFHLLELSSTLFTDHAHKQRLVKIPVGTQIERLSDGSIAFPDRTVLVKTFYYYNDERNIRLGKRVIETRLLIKEDNTWNVATYLWNNGQTDATLELNGFETQVNWISASGDELSTMYDVPNENECFACHQSNSSMIPLGTTLRNLNREVERKGASINQISHLQSAGVLGDFQVSEVSHIVDYNDLDQSLVDRARGYLAMNCAHCHNPYAWEAATEKEFDFRYETPLNQTGILYEEEKLVRALRDGEMPFIGTTLLDEDGVSLIFQFLDTL